VLEQDGANAVTKRWLNGDGANERWAVQTAGGATSWILPDRLGSVRDVTDMTGVVVNTVAYTAFGGVSVMTNPGAMVDSGFVNMWWDATVGLYIAHWRGYDPVTGQWQTEDPIGFSAGDANLRRYVGNNATNGVDPTGLQDPSKKSAASVLVKPPTFCAQCHGTADGKWKPLAEFPTLYDKAPSYQKLILESTDWGANDYMMQSLVDPLLPKGRHAYKSGCSGTGAFIRDQFFGEDTNPDSVGAPGSLAEDIAPVWGPGRRSVNALQNGRVGSFVVNLGLAASDLFLVRSVVGGGMKVVGSFVVKDAAIVTTETVAKSGGREAAVTASQSAAKQSTGAAGGAGGGNRSWWAYWDDLGGSTDLGQVGPRRNFGNRYNPTVTNHDVPGTWAWLDTAAHEGTHASIGRNFPIIWDLGDYSIRIGGRTVPVGVLVQYAEELLAYTIGRLRVGRVHALPAIFRDAARSVMARGVAEGLEMEYRAVLVVGGSTVGVGGRAYAL
jgi:RHS repeat-associated protein